MATPPNHEVGSAPTGRTGGSVNWGWIALGGCLGLLLLSSPIILMVLGMAFSDIHRQRVFDRTPEASEVVCHEVAPAVVARIEAGLTVPGGRLRGARAVHANRGGWLGFLAADEWFIAADVQGDRHYLGEHDIAVWRLETRGDPSTGEGAPEAAITVASGDQRRLVAADAPFRTANRLAYDVSYFPLGSPIDRPDLEDAAEACLVPAAPAVVARIEAGLKVPGTRVRGARVVRSSTDPQRWYVAADLEGVGRYAGDDDIGVWAIGWSGATPPATRAALQSVAAVNGLAEQAGAFLRSAQTHSVADAVRCANEALGRR